MKAFTFLTLSFWATLAVAPVLAAESDPVCAKADNITWVKGEGECLTIKTFATKNTVPSPTLVVFIHGDKSNGNPLEWEMGYAKQFDVEGVVGVTLARPGYPTAEGLESSGSNYGRKDSYDEHNIHAVATALQALKAHHKASKLLLVGYSGGAAYAGVILGKYPGLAEEAVMIATPANIGQWRRSHKWGGWTKSLSPHDFVEGVPKTTRIIAVTGSGDTNTSPSLASGYVDDLVGLGINAQFRLASGASHDTAPRSPEAVAAVWELLGLPAPQQSASATGMLEAVKAGDIEAVRAMIAEGADLEAPLTSLNSTALHVASYHGGSAEMVGLLVSSGAKLNVLNDDGLTPLMMAAMKDNPAAAEALIKGGADPNIQGQSSRTALHFAAREGSEAVARLLVKAGADVTLQDNKRRTAQAEARRKGKYPVATAIEEAGG